MKIIRAGKGSEDPADPVSELVAHDKFNAGLTKNQGMRADLRSDAGDFDSFVRIDAEVDAIIRHLFPGRTQ